jgi:hypothetical protein
MMHVRDNGAQQAELSQFDPDSGAVVLASGGASLYRTYVGRTSVLEGSSIDVFINDALFNATGSAGHNRTWFDGLGYALVTPTPVPVAGDYNNDGVVDEDDYTVWRDHLGDADETAINNNGDGGGVSESDFDWWKQHFGDDGSGGLASPVPEPAAALLAMLCGPLLLARRRRPGGAMAGKLS